ncbi:MAG: hypothetical protein WB714_16825, partial [Candidatus Sulfotelmatobacter sp.]
MIKAAATLTTTFSTITVTTTAAAAKLSLSPTRLLCLREAGAGFGFSVVLLGEDIGDKEGGGVFKVTKGLSTKYGAHRVRTTPISE